MCISRIISTISGFKKQVVQVILFSILFGILLPSGDAGTDIRLGVRLLLNGHPKWATCVLAPVLINTVFTIFACKELEKKGASCS